VKRLAFLLAVLALAGCGGGGEDSPTDVLGETGENLSDIRSADLSLELLFSANSGEQQGFRLDGPIALEEGKLLARVDYTQIAGENTANTTFISTGEQMFVEVDGVAYELPQNLVDEVEEATGDLEVEGLGDRIELGNWVRDPKLADGGEVGGTATDHISARLDVVNAVNGLLEIAAGFGGREAPPAVEGEAADQLRRAVEAASIDVWTGKDDRLLRRLALAIEFAPEVPGELRSALGLAVEFELSLANPNKDVSVTAPDNARPYTDLVGGD
jgi:hypothetical protein